MQQCTGQVSCTRNLRLPTAMACTASRRGVLVFCRAEDHEVWYAQLRCNFTYKEPSDKDCCAALVHWYKQCAPHGRAAKALRMVQLK